MERTETWANNSFRRVPKLDTVTGVCSCDVCIIDRRLGRSIDEIVG